MLTGDSRAEPVIENSFTILVPAYATPLRGNDDLQWHAHAWLRAYELTKNATYLDEVYKIYNLLLDPKSPWHGWNATCGGMNWWSNNPYVNTITNGLAMTGLVSLQRVTGSAAPMQGKLPHVAPPSTPPASNSPTRFAPSTDPLQASPSSSGRS
jgi:hypothetical protein